MNIKTLAIVAILANAGLMTATASAQNLFNDPKSSAKPVPVFVAPTPAATKQKSYNDAASGVADIPSGPAKSTQEIIERNKLIARNNEMITQSQRAESQARVAAAEAAQQQRWANDKAAKAAAKAASGGAGGGAYAAPAAAVAGQPARPAPIMVFTGAKKTDDKPARLFNVQ